MVRFGSIPTTDVSGHAFAVTGFLALLLVVSALVVVPASADKPRINFEKLLEYAERSHAAYMPPAKIQKSYPNTIHIAKPGTTDVPYFLETHKAKRIQIISVRGAADKWNFREARDTRTQFDPAGRAKVHPGFARAARSILTDLRPRLKPGYKIWLNGHSMGGAVACLLGIYLKDEGVDVAGIYTFGQPKFSDVNGTKLYRNLPVIRVVNQNDVVAKLPNSADGRGELYAHIGPEVILLNGPYYVFLQKRRAQRLSKNQFAMEFLPIQFAGPCHEILSGTVTFKVVFFKGGQLRRS